MFSCERDPLRFALRGLTTAAVLFLGILEPADGGAQTARSPVTFARDVAPILFQHCASCHQPEGHAPFSVLTYADVRPRAVQIAASVKSRYMPPWKPEPGYGVFAGERRLSTEQIELVQRWVEGGAREGDRADLPTSPRLATGWQLGPPDLVITLPRYVLPAGGVDEFRNFVVHVPGTGTRYVRGLEFHPNSPNVHHANVFVDPTSTSRQLDDEDPLAGYNGVIPYSAAFPDGHFLGWTPGQIAPLEPEAQAWRLEAGSDLLVQLHMVHRETPQLVAPSIGLYFTPTPPTRTPAMLRLGRQNLDIPAGEAAYMTSDTYVLPVEAEIQAVQPHAHYRAKDVKAWATLPDGRRQWLINISRWDFNWQDQYRYASPFWLPPGTRLTLEYVFDNSAANRRNPDSPPRRVVWGQRSSDEMADLWIQMSTRSERDLTRLSADLRRKMIAEDIVGHEMEIRSSPDSVVLHNDVAVLYLEAEQPAQAVAHFAAVSRLQPNSAPARFNLAKALEKAGRDADAIEEYRASVQFDPSYIRAVKGLANALLVAGKSGEAIAEYDRLLALDPSDPEGHNNQGFARLQVGELSGAIGSLRRAIQLKPSYADAHYNLARALTRSGQPAAALIQFRAAIAVRPDWIPALTDLAWLQATTADVNTRDPPTAIQTALRAVDLSGHQDGAALDVLAAAYAAAGRFDEAQKTAEAAAVTALSSPSLLLRIEDHLRLFRAGQAVVVP